MKLAVMFSGQRRTYDKTRRELIAMFSSVKASKYYFYISPDNDLCDDIGERHLFVTKKFDVDFSKINYPTHCADKRKAITDQWSALSICASVCRVFKFDWVVRVRPDLKVLEPMETDLESLEPALYFPAHNNWGGLNDRFWFGPSKMMEQSFEYYESANRFLGRARLNLERLLSRHIILARRLPIRRTKAVLTPMRTDGSIEEPVYRADRGDLPEKTNAELCISSR